MLVPIDIAVKEALNREGRTTPHVYARYLQYGQECIRDELRNASQHYIKSVKLPVNGNGTVDCPPGYITYNKIGIQKGDKIVMLSLNEAMPYQLNTDSCGNPEQNIPEATGLTGIPDYYFFNYYNTGIGWGVLYGWGAPANPYGEYKPIVQNNQIQFNSRMTADYIYMEYVTSQLIEDGRTMIPMEYIQAVRDYILWIDKEYKVNTSATVKQMAKAQYIRSKRIAIAQANPITKKEFHDLMLRHYSQTVKT